VPGSGSRIWSPPCDDALRNTIDAQKYSVGDCANSPRDYSTQVYGEFIIARCRRAGDDNFQEKKVLAYPTIGNVYPVFNIDSGNLW
jgi:hypothetical protein